MTTLLRFLTISIIALNFAACTKEDDEPFEYPETEITEPTTVNHLTRKVDAGEDWHIGAEAFNCPGGLSVENYASIDTNYSRNVLTMHLIPDSNQCAPHVWAGCGFNADEMASNYWDNWKFEFTFSELRLSSTAKLIIELRYREVELTLDLAPRMRETIAPDTSIIGTDGVFTFTIDNGNAFFNINGTNWTPDFNPGNDNVLNTASTNQNFGFNVDLSSENTQMQSLLTFSFLRISSFGIPEE